MDSFVKDMIQHHDPVMDGMIGYNEWYFAASEYQQPLNVPLKGNWQPSEGCLPLPSTKFGNPGELKKRTQSFQPVQDPMMANWWPYGLDVPVPPFAPTSTWSGESDPTTSKKIGNGLPDTVGTVSVAPILENPSSFCKKQTARTCQQNFTGTEGYKVEYGRSLALAGEQAIPFNPRKNMVDSSYTDCVKFCHRQTPNSSDLDNFGHSPDHSPLSIDLGIYQLPHLNISDYQVDSRPNQLPLPQAKEEKRLTGGFSSADYPGSSAFKVCHQHFHSSPLQQARIEAESSFVWNDNLDRNGRRLSEPFNIGASMLWAKHTADVRSEEMQQKMLCAQDRSRNQLEEDSHGPPSAGVGLDYKHRLDSSTGPGNLQVAFLPSHNSQSFHGRQTRAAHRSKMGQEASQLQASANLRHDVRLGHRDVSTTNGWTSVNSGSHQVAGKNQASTTNGHGNERKRKRSPIGASNGIGASRYVSSSLPSHPVARGLGITMPSHDPIAPSQPAASHGTKTNSIRLAARDVGALSRPAHGGHEPHVVHNGKSESKSNDRSHRKSGGTGDDSDSDAEALGLLQRVAAAESDDEDDPPSSASPPKVREIRPNGAPQGWRMPPNSLAGTHYTIYSPHVQGPSYAPRQAADTFDPNGPLSAHEEAQLRDEGRFTKMEQSFLRDAIDEYCKKHNISVKLANDYVCGKAREGNIPGDFWDEVCKALPQRTKNSIQRAAKRVFRNGQKKGTWTAEEESALSQAYHLAPDQWAKICEEVPGRSAEQCRDRWRNYTQNGGQLTRGPWADSEETKFVEICKTMLREAGIERNNQRQQGRTISTKFEAIDHLNFTAISSLMDGKRSRLHCRNKWHKLKKRPDVEALIEAVVKGDVMPISALSKAEVELTPSNTEDPNNTLKEAQATRTQPTPVSHTTSPLAVRPAASTSMNLMSATAQPVGLASSIHQPIQYAPFTGLHPYRASLMNPNYSTPHNSQTPQPFPAHVRLSSTLAPSLQPTQHSRPALPSPVPSAPAVSQACKQPSILAPFTDPRPEPTPQESSISAAPSWINAPPRVPQLFAPPVASAATTDSPLLSLGSGLCGSVDGLSAMAPATPTSASYNASYPDSRRTAMTERGPMLAPITYLSSTRHSQQPLTHTEIPSLYNLDRPNVTHPVPVQKTPDTQIVRSSTPVARMSSESSPSQATSISPESVSSPTTLGGKLDGRPIRKKQKTVKAKGAW